jgi:hypothetical protein
MRKERELICGKFIPPTYKNIWRGCYDIWFCQQDRIDGQEMMKFQTEKAEKAGFIKS